MPSHHRDGVRMRQAEPMSEEAYRTIAYRICRARLFLLDSARFKGRSHGNSGTLERIDEGLDEGHGQGHGSVERALFGADGFRQGERSGERVPLRPQIN